MSESTYDKGSKFENRVANLYETLGFDVKRNINVSGHQVDMIVSKFIAGMGLVTCAVESKSRNSNLGVNEIAEFVNAATQLVQDGDVQSAVCVTDTDYSQDARSSVSKKRFIRLLTFKELQKDLFSFTQCLIEWCRQLEGKPVFTEYIPLAGTDVAGKTIKDIVSYAEDWTQTGEQLLIIAGDFGSGKTTVAERLVYHIAQKYLKTSNCVFPLFIPLRSFRQYKSVFDLVQATVKSIYSISITQSHFEAMLKSGDLVVVLDGFDEIDTGARATDRARYMSQLAYVVGRGSPCILTTRPTYFQFLS